MQQLLESRRIYVDQGVKVKLNDISPDKYGKAAFCHLSFTPSKLADNVLFKQVTTMKKVQESSGKYRKAQALNGFFKDRLEQLQAQRDGIENSLTQQINMYRKMLHEMELKHEARIREIQENFNTQIHNIITEKEEQVKFAQSQRELLENRIYELEQIIADLKAELGNKCAEYDHLSNQHDKLNINYHNLQKKLNETIIRNDQQAQKAKQQYCKLEEILERTIKQWNNKLEKSTQEHIIQTEKRQKQRRNQVEKQQTRHKQQSNIKSQEMRDARNIFQKETNRLNQIIKNKQQQIVNSKQQQNQQRVNTLNMMKKYENQITNHVNDKKHMSEQNVQIKKEKDMLSNDLLQLEGMYRTQKKNMQEDNVKLKKDLQMNQVNYIRERDRNGFVAGDLERQIVRLQAENTELVAAHGSSTTSLSIEMANLRQLLKDSCFQIQKCKQQYINVTKQKDIILIQMRQLLYENEALHRLKVQQGQTLQTFQDSYYRRGHHH